MYMMKRKGFILCLVLVVMLLLTGLAAADTVDPIVTSMELTPSKLTGPGTIAVTITISNSGDTDLQDPVVLYDPAAQIVADFGTNGSAMLKAGETRTWTGEYDVNQRTLDNGFVVYYVKYTLYNENGKAVEQSQSIRQTISQQTAETAMEVKRTISPSIAREGQSIVVRYDISNTGTVALLNVGIQENSDIYGKKQTIPRLNPGETAEVKYPVTMGTRDLTSGAVITYSSETEEKEQTYTVQDQVIRFGEPSLEASLKASAKGVVQNGAVTLTLVLKNTGSVDYSDIRVSDPSLGDVFTNQELKAGKTLELTKEVTVPATTEYQFTINATDATGSEMAVSTEAVSVTAVNPEDALGLEVIATPDRTEVFEQPGQVRFTLTITNTSKVDASNVKVSHGDTELYTFTSIPAGESRTMSRDFALSMAGKYRFTVSAVDPLDGTMTFQSNETQIAFSVPTPAPATPTPAPDPTPEPTFAAATIPPITDRSVGTIPKFAQMILLPVMILSGVALIACVVLLIIASKRRREQKKASEAAVDQLERAQRRDYITPGDGNEEETQEYDQPDENTPEEPHSMKLEDEAFELPHMKYARSARPAEPVENDDAYQNGYSNEQYDYMPAETAEDEDQSQQYGDQYGWDESAYQEASDDDAYAAEEPAGYDEPDDAGETQAEGYQTEPFFTGMDEEQSVQAQQPAMRKGRRSRRSRSSDLNA